MAYSRTILYRHLTYMKCSCYLSKKNIFFFRLFKLLFSYFLQIWQTTKYIMQIKEIREIYFQWSLHCVVRRIMRATGYLNWFANILCIDWAIFYLFLNTFLIQIVFFTSWICLLNDLKCLVMSIICHGLLLWWEWLIEKNARQISTRWTGDKWRRTFPPIDAWKPWIFSSTFL